MSSCLQYQHDQQQSDIVYRIYHIILTASRQCRHVAHVISPIMIFEFLSISVHHFLLVAVNSLPDTVVNCATVGTFKRKLASIDLSRFVVLNCF